jgi:ABC-type nitrate/sulfonate/bicarbonate transport system substrate-binding protein
MFEEISEIKEEALRYETNAIIEHKPLCNCNLAKCSRKEWAEKNPEKIREYQRKYKEKNPEKRKAINDNWTKNNPEKVRDYLRKYKEKNKEKVNRQERQRRAWKKIQIEFLSNFNIE